MEIVEHSPGRLQEARTALREMHRAFVTYVEGVNRGERPSRSEVVRWTLPAQHALDLAGFNVEVPPPPMFAGRMPTRYGLPNTIFLFEESGWDQVPQLIDRCLIMADGHLAAQMTELARKRRNPFYWADRMLRGFFRVPAYIVSLFAGVSVDKVDGGAWGRLVRVFGLAIELAGLYVGAAQLGWI